MTDVNKWFKRVSSLLIIGVSVLILVQSFGLGIGDLKTPGPGFTSFLASSLALLLCLIVFVKEIVASTREDETKSPLSWKNLAKPAGAMMMLMVFVLFLKAFGYLIACFFLMFGMLFIYSPKGWRTHIFVAIGVAVLTFFVFQTWLGVRFPSGSVFSIGS
jgi:putative tricarboxylic transport membrane protein